jgi:hypothetical protein
MFEGEKQPDAVHINRGSNIFEPDYSLNPPINNDFINTNKKNDGFEFLNNANGVEAAKFLVRSELVEPSVDAGFISGPQMLRSNYEAKYEDDNQFAFLIDEPAYMRERKENKEDFQNKALQHNHAPSFKLDNELDEFFKNLPD